MIYKAPKSQRESEREGGKGRREGGKKVSLPVLSRQ